MSIKFCMSIVRDTRGTSAVEMGLICAMIVLAMMGAIKGFANESVGLWNKINTSVTTANGG